MGSLCSTSMVAPDGDDSNAVANVPKYLSGFYMYDFASSVFTNSILLIPLLITEQTKKQAIGDKAWMDHYECVQQVSRGENSSR